jgi:hypothetical protein
VVKSRQTTKSNVASSFSITAQELVTELSVRPSLSPANSDQALEETFLYSVTSQLGGDFLPLLKRFGSLPFSLFSVLFYS